jgi:hypothetical protein
MFTISSNLQRWKPNRLKRSLVVQLFGIRQYHAEHLHYSKHTNIMQSECSHFQQTHSLCHTRTSEYLHRKNNYIWLQQCIWLWHVQYEARFRYVTDTCPLCHTSESESAYIHRKNIMYNCIYIYIYIYIYIITVFSCFFYIRMCVCTYVCMYVCMYV